MMTDSGRFGNKKISSVIKYLDPQGSSEFKGIGTVLSNDIKSLYANIPGEPLFSGFLESLL
jgi:hypothetical protein